MASVNWMKVSTQKAGAMYTHMDNKARASHNHSNQDIDTSKTRLNYSIGAASWGDAMRCLKDRTKEVDAVKPPLRVKKDRVTGCVLEFACPQAIKDMGRSDEFFARMHSLFQQEFGEKNVHGTFVHKDEIHEYTDSATHEKRSSLEHAHTLVSAYTEEKGINGKAFESRASLKKLNKAVNDMCLKTFGVEYNTHETPRHQKVEDLKLESKIEAKRAEYQELKKQIQMLSAQYDELFDKNCAEHARLLHIQKKLANVEKELTIPMDKYPEGVEEGTRGIFDKELIVKVPKKTWDEMYHSFSAQKGVAKALIDLRDLVQQLDDEFQGKDKELLKRQLNALQKERDKLVGEIKEMRHEPSYNDCVTEINKVLQRMPPESAKKFAEAWNDLHTNPEIDHNKRDER